MRKICKLIPYTLILFSTLCAPSAQAMENPAQDHSDMNETICHALESIFATTSTLSDEERNRLEQLIVAVKYSNPTMMTEDDFERFLKNYRSIMRASDEARAWYLTHLRPYLDEDDVLLIEVKKTAPETLLMLHSYIHYFVTKLYPAMVMPIVEYSFFLQLQSAWERGEDGHKEIAKWLQSHTLAYMAYFPREPIDRIIGKFGIFTMAFRQMSYEQLQGMGQLYKEAFMEMLGWFINR